MSDELLQPKVELCLQQIANELRTMNDTLLLITAYQMIPPDHAAMYQEYENRLNSIVEKLKENRNGAGLIWRYP